MLVVHNDKICSLMCSLHAKSMLTSEIVLHNLQIGNFLCILPLQHMLCNHTNYTNSWGGNRIVCSAPPQHGGRWRSLLWKFFWKMLTQNVYMNILLCTQARSSPTTIPDHGHAIWCYTKTRVTDGQLGHRCPKTERGTFLKAGPITAFAEGNFFTKIFQCLESHFWYGYFSLC